MSDAKAQSRQRAIDHMARLLQMNPIHQGEEIVAARIEALGLAKKADGARPAVAEEHRVDRRQMLDQLESIRSQFWALSPDALSRQLDAFDSHNFVDLEVAINRLRVVAAHRAKFPALAEKSGFDGDFFSPLKEILIRSPRDTAVVREQVLSTFRNGSRRSKRGRQMVALLKTEMPAIHDLEADWFNTLCRQKSSTSKVFVTNSDRSTVAGKVLGAGLGGYRWYIWLMIIAAGRLMSGVTSNNNSQYYSPPNYQYQEPIPNTPEELRKRFERMQRELPYDTGRRANEQDYNQNPPDSAEGSESSSPNDDDSFPGPIFLHRTAPR